MAVVYNRHLWYGCGHPLERLRNAVERHALPLLVVIIGFTLEHSLTGSPGDVTRLCPYGQRRDTPTWAAPDARFTRWFLEFGTYVLRPTGLLRALALNDVVCDAGQLSCARMGSGGIPLNGTSPALALNDAVCSAGQLSCARTGSGGVPLSGTSPAIVLNDALDAKFCVRAARPVFLTMITRASCVVCISCTTCCSTGRQERIRTKLELSY